MLLANNHIVDVLLLIDYSVLGRGVLVRKNLKTETTCLRKATGLDHKMAYLIVGHLQVPQHQYNTLPCSHLMRTQASIVRNPTCSAFCLYDAGGSRRRT